MNVLERLHELRSSLLNNHYVFTDWQSCTCGHIYKTATEKALPDRSSAAKQRMNNDNDPLFREIVRVVIAANYATVYKEQPDRTIIEDDPLVVISDLTAAGSITKGSGKPDYRNRAVELIDNAIKMVEAEQQQARLDVLAQAENVVNSADASEELELV